MTRPPALDTLGQLATVEKERDALRALLQAYYDSGEWRDDLNMVYSCVWCGEPIHLIGPDDDFITVIQHGEHCLIERIEQALGIVRGEAQGVAK